MLKRISPDLPLFIQAHSMGCLATATFLINNQQINVQGLILGSPFWGFSSEHKIGFL
jgi:alpha-beta hydrolase superfamily lysophospholipase